MARQRTFKRGVYAITIRDLGVEWDSVTREYQRWWHITVKAGRREVLDTIAHLWTDSAAKVADIVFESLPGTTP